MNEEQKEIFERYLEDTKERGHSLQWIKNLKSRVSKYFSYLNEMGISINQVKIKDAIDYQRWLIETGRRDGNKYSNGMIGSFMTVATNFSNYLKREKVIYTNPFLEVKKIRSELKLPRNVLKEKEMNMLLNEVANFDERKGNMITKITRYKVHVACELMYATGLRSTEVANIKVNDIDFSKGLVHVIQGKGGASRMALLNDYAKSILRLYVEEMRDCIFNVWNKKNESLFGIGWERFNKVINGVLREASKKLELGNFTSHCFRHSLGYHLLRSGCDIRYIQSILGHKRLSSTEIYTKVDKEDLQEVFNIYHPRQFWNVKE